MSRLVLVKKSEWGNQSHSDTCWSKTIKSTVKENTLWAMCSDCSSFSFGKYMCEVDLLLRKERQLVEVMVYESRLRRLSPLNPGIHLFSKHLYL